MVAGIYPKTISCTTAISAGVMPALQNSSTAPLKCPRCDSTNTKFCYYNNYSLAQPRHFCKACKRYWTRGGNLRNVPVGGGCRKNKRHKKPQLFTGTTSPKALPLRCSSNSLPVQTSQVNDIPPTDLVNLFFPRLDLALHPVVFDETIQSVIGSHIVDPQRSAATGGNNQPPLFSPDDQSTAMREGLKLLKENPMEPIYSFGGSGSAASESAFFYGFPEFCSPMVPLL